MSTRVKVIAHRGASHARPENTLPAFTHAVELGTDLLGFDCRATADGHVVVMHDSTVDRTTDGSGPVGSLTLAEIQSLDAGAWFHETYAGTRVPTLPEVLELAKASGVGLDVQIYATDDDRESLTGTVVRALADHGFDERAFIAAEEEVVLLVKELDPTRPICNLTGQRTASSLEHNQEIGSLIVQAFARYVTDDFARRAHKMGIVVNVFYADHVTEMKRLIECGIDGILTNEPGLLLGLLDRPPQDA